MARAAASSRARASSSIVQTDVPVAVESLVVATFLMSAPMRRRSSEAARSVNVTTSISSSRASPRTNRSTTRCSIKNVLPVPADASMTADRSRAIRPSSSGKG